MDIAFLFIDRFDILDAVFLAPICGFVAITLFINRLNRYMSNHPIQITFDEFDEETKSHHETMKINIMDLLRGR